MIVKDEQKRLEDSQKHEKAVLDKRQLIEFDKNDLEKQLSAPTNAQK